jgi:SAM-dependent methyltransferase
VAGDEALDATEALRARYDETPYRDQAFHELDLTRLLGLASLFLERTPSRDPGELRVLDLCCASAVHLCDQAKRHPGVRFTGVDFSASEIEAGRRRIAESGIEGVELIASDLLAFEPDEGAYDLVLCHGAFSWVPDPVKERILALCRRALRPTGVAAIAYLTYPGWKQREAIRELLAARVEGVADPEERVRRSALLLRLLHAGYSAAEANPHAASLKAVVESMQRAPANVFLHDELGLEHDPCYFVQFVEWAAEAGLQYVAEADLGTMAIGGLSGEAGPLLQALGPDFLETQQLIDFLVNRSGRTSILARDDAPMARALRAERLAGLSFSTHFANLRPADAAPDAPDRFESLTGRRVVLEDEADKRLVTGLARATPEALAFDTLAESEAEHGFDRDALLRRLAGLVALGVVDPRWPLEAPKPDRD